MPILKKLSSALLVILVFSTFVTAEVIPSEVLSQIKETAQANHPGDYQTQRYVIDSQTKAYFEIKNYSAPKVPANILKEIFKNAQAGHPGDYKTQKYVIDSQTKAYLSLQ